MVPLVAIVGATATGKTEVGERVADRLDGEIVCADSRQVYRDLEIGTGKPTPAERGARPHHLFDSLGLEAIASAGWYSRAAAKACAAIRAGGRVPVLVGGSGLYLRAALEGLAPTPAVPEPIRARIRDALEATGPEALHVRLRAVDPAAAARLGPRDAQRIARALEVFEATGRSLSDWHAAPAVSAVPGPWRVIELTVLPQSLAARIRARTRALFAQGLVEETRSLVARGLGAALRRRCAIGYDEALDLIEGRLSQAEAETLTSLRTERLAKRQRTWFRHQVDAIRLDASETPLDALVARVLESAR